MLMQIVFLTFAQSFREKRQLRCFERWLLQMNDLRAFQGGNCEEPPRNRTKRQGTAFLFQSAILLYTMHTGVGENRSRLQVSANPRCEKVCDPFI